MANKCPAGCPAIEDLPGLAELSADDPGREHLDACPRCQARLATYREFLAGDGPVDQDLLTRSVDRLGDELDREIFGTTASETPEAKPASASILNWRSPWVRSAMGIAATVLFFFAIEGLWEGPGSQLDSTQLRSDRTGQVDDDPFHNLTRALADGGLDLSWDANPEADTYRVEILDASFERLATLPVDGEPTLQLPAARLEEILPGPGAYVWVAVALLNGDEISRSAPVAFNFGSAR